MPAAAAASEIIPAEKRLVDKRRRVRRDETKPSAPATKTAGSVPYEQAMRKTKASERVKVILSRLRPEGRVKVFGNRPMKIISGTKPIRTSCSRRE